MMAGKTEVGVVTGKGNVKKAQYALEASAKVLPYYNDYFGVDFPLPKLDNVAGPGQSQFFSAMENWGAIFTFERVLLDDPRITTEADKQHIFVVLAHEMAHQWFGDLVTMAWWDDLDRKSFVQGKGGSVRVDLGGCRVIKKKKKIRT